MQAKRIAVLALLTGQALLMFMVEGLFPPLFLPGAKMGLSNIFTLLALAVLGPGQALALVVVRTVLGSCFAGSLSTLMYSLPAGVVSVLASALLLRLFWGRVSLTAVSITAAVLHNLTQNLMFCLITQTPQMYAYMPYLALIGVLAGFITGRVVHLVIRRLPTRLLAQILPPSA